MIEDYLPQTEEESDLLDVMSEVMGRRDKAISYFTNLAYDFMKREAKEYPDDFVYDARFKFIEWSFLQDLCSEVGERYIPPLWSGGGRYD